MIFPCRLQDSGHKIRHPVNPVNPAYIFRNTACVTSAVVAVPPRSGGSGPFRLLFGLPGLLLGPLVGAVIGEWLARRDAWRAGQVGLATLFGLVLGMLAKVGCALAMLLVFAWAWWG